MELVARPLSPFRFRVLPTHDASKVRASGPGLTSGVPASFPVEFSIDTKDAGQGQLSVLITVSTEPIRSHMQSVFNGEIIPEKSKFSVALGHV